MSIRLRLTLLYSAILATTLLAFGAGLYVTVERRAFRLYEDTLREDVTRLIALQESEPGRVTLPSSKYTPQTYARILDPDTGEAVRQSPNISDDGITVPQPDRQQLGAALDGQSAPYIEETNNGRLLVYNKAIQLSRGGRTVAIAILQVARPLGAYDQLLDTLRRVLLLGGSIVTLGAFGFGWALSGIALRPIKRITQTARAIGDNHDFGRRVDHIGPADEVGRLATTFNAMLEALQAAYTRTEHTLAAQRRFVADASHELRTPLTTIRGNLGLLQREPPIGEADRVAVLADMVAETERMSRLINDLLTLARADAGRPPRAEPVPLAPLLEGVRRQTGLLAPERAIEWEALGSTNGVAPAAVGDRDALQQVLLILLDNAIKYTPAEGKIAVSAATAGGQVAIAVRDWGIGIAPDAMPHLFERFYQVDPTRTGAGAGLGLSIAKALVDAQGGTLTVESEPGRGSTFTVTLPAAPASTTLEPAPELVVGAAAMRAVR